MSAHKAVCFLAVEDGKNETLGPISVWIAIHHNTTNTLAICDAMPDILHILTGAEITDVIILG